MAEGGAVTRVSVVTDRLVEGRPAIPVEAVATDAGNLTIGGAAVPVVVITDADLVQNGGAWLVEGRPQPWRVVAAEEGALVDGRVAALPVYVVSGSLSNAPLPPINLTVLPTGAALDDVLVEWETQTPGATYEVEYSVNGADYVLLTTTAADATSYTHTNPTLGEATHYYRIRATNGVSESAWVTASLMGWKLAVRAYWKLNEASGNRADSVGTSTATDNNTVGSTTGVQGNAARFIAANSEYLEVAANPIINLGNAAYTWAFWVYRASGMGGQEGLLGKWGGASTDYTFKLLSDGRIRAQLYRGGDVTLITTATITFDDWNLVVIQHDATAHLLKISINANTAETTATGGNLDAAGGEPLSIGASEGLLGTTDQDEIALALRVWSDAEIDSFYNNGNGTTY